MPPVWHLQGISLTLQAMHASFTFGCPFNTPEGRKAFLLPGKGQKEKEWLQHIYGV